jgi:hypothetical protein
METGSGTMCASPSIDVNSMHQPPDILDEAKVILYTRIDDRHITSGLTQHSRSGELQSGFAGLVIAQYPCDSGFYLFYCDAEWRVENDTLHDSLDGAKAQAEFELRGTIGTWIAK